jgi:hypothetical protein
MLFGLTRCTIEESDRRSWERIYLSKGVKMGNLAAHIAQTRLIDTHEHLHSEQKFVEQGPDLLQALFDNYVTADLLVAGASEDAVRHLLDASDPDLTSRLKGVRDAWQRCRHTGYGEAVRHIARLVYDIEEIT